MFAKLIRHEWRNCRQVLGILCIITLGAGLTMGLSGIWLTWNEGQRSYVLAILLLFVAAMAIGICAAGGFFYLIWRFYQSRFTDEGYLTFTLPVNNHQQLLAALVNIFRGSALVLLATLGAFALMGLSYLAFFVNWGELFQRDMNWSGLFQAVARYIPEIWDTIVWGDLLRFLVLLLSNLTALVVKLMLCITLGAVLARKHKLLAAVAAWFAIGMVQSWGLLALGFHNAFSNGLFVDYGIASNLVITVLGYLGTYWLLEKKLNLT